MAHKNAHFGFDLEEISLRITMEARRKREHVVTEVTTETAVSIGCVVVTKRITIIAEKHNRAEASAFEVC